MKLFHKLLLLTAAVGMVPLIVGGILLTRINQQGMEDNILERRVEGAKYHAALIDTYLTNTIKNVNTAAGEKDFTSMQRREVEEVFRFLMTQYDQLRVVAWIGSDRVERARAVSMEEVAPSNLGAFTDHVNAVFAPVMAEQQVVFSEVYPGRSENVVVVAMPYRDRGVLAIEISLKPVQATIEAIRPGRAGYAVLLDQKARVVAHVKPQIARARETLTVPAFDGPLRNWMAGTGKYGSGEGDMLESHQPLQAAKWMLFIVEPEKDAFFAAENMKKTTILLVVGALLLALSAGLYISRTIVSNMYKLLAGTKEIGAGNLSHRMGLESRDEIGELSRAFDSMGDSLQSREQEIANIEEMSRSLGTILELDSLLLRGAETVLRVVPSKKAGIYVGNGDGMKLRHSVGDLPETVELGDAFKDATEAVMKARTLYVPLRHEAHLLGCLVLEDRNDGRPFGANDRRFVQVVGSSISLAMRNIQLLQEMVQTARMTAELKTAEVVQQTLFPRGDLLEPGLHLSGFIRSASETGGDWYGYIREPGGNRVVVMIGDVTGHGVPAALVTAATHSFFQSLEQFCTLLTATYGRAVAVDLLAPGLILSQLNRIILASTNRQLLMTFFIATIDPRSGTVTFANAGHPFPYLYRAAEGVPDNKRLTVLKANGPRVGEDPYHAWKEETETLGQSDVIVCFTDGVQECVGPDGTAYGDRRLRQLIPTLAGLSAPAIRTKIVKDIEAHRDGTHLRDDVTVVVGKMQAAGKVDVLLAGAAPGTIEAMARSGVRVVNHLTGEGAVGAIRPDGRTLFIQNVPAGPPTGDLAAVEAEAHRRCPLLTSGWMINASLDQVIPLVAETPRSLHVFGLNPDLDAMELAAVIRAEAESRPVTVDDLVERGLGQRSLGASSLADEVTDQVVASARDEGATELALESLKMVLDEMLTNAFYHAPRTEAGDPKYSTLNRAAPVLLPPGCEVRVQWGVRGDDMAVEVTDPYGTLSTSIFVDHMRRGLAAGTADLKFLAASAGAGLGLFVLAQTASRLFVGIEPGKRTSVLCVLDMRARRKKMAEWVRSLHVVEYAEKIQDPG